MTPKQYNEMMRQAEVLEEHKKNVEIDKQWKEIEDQYHSDEYPPFGGPFTDALPIWEWLRRNYLPPTRR